MTIQIKKQQLQQGVRKKSEKAEKRLRKNILSSTLFRRSTFKHYKKGVKSWLSLAEKLSARNKSRLRPGN
jgi:hypothetical protein